MHFSRRVPSDLAPNRFSVALASARTGNAPLLDLTVSNPTAVGLHYPPDLLAPLASPSSLVYDPQPFGLPAARQAVADDFARRGVVLGSDRVVLTASTSEAYSVLFKLLCEPGDRVAVPRPSYPLFEHLTRLDAVETDSYLLEYHGRWSVDPDSLARAVVPRTRAVLAVSPNNPTGSFLDDRDLDAIVAVCREHELALISDEVFCDYRLTSSASSPPGDQSVWSSSSGGGSVLGRSDILTFSLGGLSKSAGLPQLKLGWIGVSGAGDVVRAALARLEVICDSYLSVGTPIQHATGALLAAAGAIRSAIAGRIARNYASLHQLVTGYPSCAVLPAEGGWYAVIQVPATESEENLVVALLERDGVVVYPGYFFDFPREAFLVVSLLPAPDTFDGAITRLFERAVRSIHVD